MSMSVEDKLLETADRNRRPEDAYRCIFEALGDTVRIKGGRHVTGQDLCVVFAKVALSHFGGLAKTVLGHWGMRSTRDIGNVVWELVEADLMGIQDNDSVDDFDNVFDWDRIFNLDAYVRAVAEAQDKAIAGG